MLYLFFYVYKVLSLVTQVIMWIIVNVIMFVFIFKVNLKFELYSMSKTLSRPVSGDCEYASLKEFFSIKKSFTK